MEAEIKSEKQDSIKLSKTSTGKYSHEIKLYFDDKDDKAETIIDRIKLLDQTMKDSFKEEQK